MVRFVREISSVNSLARAIEATQFMYFSNLVRESNFQAKMVEVVDASQ